MHGCFDPVLVYGVRHSPNYDKALTSSCSDLGLNMYATSVVKDYATWLVYGTEASWTKWSDEGLLEMKVEPGEKEKVWSFYKHVKETYGDEDFGGLQPGLPNGNIWRF